MFLINAMEYLKRELSADGNALYGNWSWKNCLSMPYYSSLYPCYTGKEVRLLNPKIIKLNHDLYRKGLSLDEQHKFESLIKWSRFYRLYSL